MRLTIAPICSMQYVVVCLCAILAGAFSSLIIVSDFSPPAIYTAQMGPKLYFKMLNIDGGRRNISAPACVDYDPVDKKIYWTQWSSKWTGAGLIARCDLNGNEYQESVKELDYAVGIAIDVQGRKMYFSHEGMALVRANLDGSGRRDIIRELPTIGFHVFFDPIGRRVWWSDATTSLIESSKEDGSNRTVHVSGLRYPSDLFIDARQLYFSDFGTDRISTSSLRGKNLRTLYQYPWMSTETLPMSIGLFKNEIYMVNRDHPKLQKIPKNIKEGQVIVPRDVGNVDFGWPSGLYIEPVATMHPVTTIPSSTSDANTASGTLDDQKLDNNNEVFAIAISLPIIGSIIIGVNVCLFYFKFKSGRSKSTTDKPPTENPESAYTGLNPSTMSCTAYDTYEPAYEYLNNGAEETVDAPRSNNVPSLEEDPDLTYTDIESTTLNKTCDHDENLDQTYADVDPPTSMISSYSTYLSPDDNVTTDTNTSRTNVPSPTENADSTYDIKRGPTS